MSGPSLLSAPRDQLVALAHVNGVWALYNYGWLPDVVLRSRISIHLGLYYYKAQFYSPTLGRFLQMDPVWTKDDLNLYTCGH